MGLGHYQKKITDTLRVELRTKSGPRTKYARTWGLALREPILTKMNALRHFPTAAADRDK